MKQSAKKFLLYAVMAAMSSGCSTPIKKETRHNIEQTKTLVTDHLESQKNDAKPAYRVVDDRYFLGSKVMTERKEIPDILRRHVSMSSKAPHNILAIADKIAAQSGIPVRVEPDVLMELGEKESGGDSGPGFMPMALQAPNVSEETTSDQILSLPPISPVTAKLSEIPYYHNGPLNEFLDLVAARMDIDWRYDKIRKEIVFYRYEVKSWKLEFLANGFSSSLGSNGSTDDESGSEGVTTTYTVDASKRYETFQQGLQPLITSNAIVHIDPTSGVLTIRDRRSNIAQIDRYIKEQNIAYNRQILLTIQVLSVEEGRSQNFALDWSALYGGSDVSISTVSTSPISIENGLDLVTSIVRPTSPFKGSKLNVKALTAQDGVSLMYSETVRTLNGRAVPFNAVTEQTYLARVSSSVDSNGAATTSLEPDTLTTGLTLLATPLITDNNDILLSLSLDVSTLVRMDQVSSGGQSINTPEVSRQRHSQEIRLPAGASAVIHGYQLNTSSSYESGIGQKLWRFLGGSSSNDVRKGRVAVVVTPIIIN